MKRSEKKIEEEKVAKTSESVENKKSKKNIRKNEIRNKQKEFEIKIDKLRVELKSTKDKFEKKKIKSEIRNLKKQRKEIGVKDTYLRDVKKEMELVRWPSSKEVFKYSLACLIFVVFFALFFFGMDALFSLVKDLIS